MSEDSETTLLAEISDPPRPQGKAGPSEAKALESHIETERKRTELEGIRQDIEERKKYASHIFWLAAFWVLCMMLLLFFQGFLNAPIEVAAYNTKCLIAFQLSDSIVMTAIGSTTATVLGLFAIVANYLFPKR